MCFFVNLIPDSASASGGGLAVDDSTLVIISGITSLFATAIGGGIYTKAQNNRRKTFKVKAFLKDNRTHLRSELAMGSGKVLDDFANLMAIPESAVHAFKKELRKNRKYVSSFCEARNISDVRINELIVWINSLHSVQRS